MIWAKKDGATLTCSKRARPSPDMEEHSSSANDSPVASPIRAPETKAKFSITKAFQKMNCFFMDKQHQDYKAYKAGKASRRNQRAIMTALKLTQDGPSSDELDEEKWKSKNTFWLGDDLSSLGQFRPSYLAEASTSQVPPTDELHVVHHEGDSQDTDADPDAQDDEDDAQDTDADPDGQDEEDEEDDEDYME